MRSYFLRATALAPAVILLVAGCADTTTEVVDELQEPQFAKGGEKGKPIDFVPAQGRFRDSLTDRVTSNPTGVPYKASFRPSPNGSLAMSAYHQDRTFSFDFVADSGLPVAGPYAAYSGTAGDNLLDMPVGSELRTSYTFLWSAPEEGYDEVVDWWLKFGETDCAGNWNRDSQVLVTHPDSITWTLTPPSEHDDSLALVCRSRRKREKGKGRVTVGEFYMPFRVFITSPPPEEP